MGHDHNPAAMPRRDQDIELLKREKIPPPNRDVCAHLLVPLNNCRKDNYCLPFRCTEERHLYEECLYIAFEQRVAAKQKMLREKRDAEELAALQASLNK